MKRLVAVIVGLVVATSAQAQTSDAEGIMNTLQADYDYAMAVGKTAADAYDAGNYSQACQGFRSAANLLQSVADRAYNTAFKMVAGVDNRALLSMSKDLDSFASDTRTLAAEVCEKAGD